MGAVMAAPTGAGGGHGVEEGVAERRLLFAAGPAGRHGGCGPGVGRGLWEAG